jgi:hypothetical protein
MTGNRIFFWPRLRRKNPTASYLWAMRVPRWPPFEKPNAMRRVETGENGCYRTEEN